MRITSQVRDYGWRHQKERDRLVTGKEVCQAERGSHCFPAPFSALLHLAFPPHSLHPVPLPFGLGTHP